MTPYCLTEEEFKSKLPSDMFEVTESAEAILDIWPYVKSLVQLHIISEYVYINFQVAYVYRDSLKTYDHILLPTINTNIYVVLIVNIEKENIDGYYVLNLVNEYRLS